MPDQLKPDDHSDLIPVQTLSQFAAMVQFWHGGVMNKIDNLLEIPEGTGVTLNEDGTDKEVVLTGDALLGFKAALYTIKAEFYLPFQVGYDDAPAPESTGQ